MAEPSEALAARWFGVRGEYERAGRVRMTWLTIREFLLALVTLGVFLGEFDPKRFCDVVVFSRDSGEPVAMFSYSHLGEATLHLRDLSSRLGTMHVYDFCRELGLGPDLVVGPGRDGEPADPVWVPMSRAQRVRNQSA